MTTLTLTPTDGTALDLLDPDAVMLLREGSEGVLPVPVFDEEYAESPDTEGGRRVRSRPQNPSGTGRVMITGATSEALWANVAAWQETAEAVRRDGGVLAYTPLDGTEVSYDLDSFSITAMPQDVNAVEHAGYAISEFTYVAMPFGRLEPVTVDAGTTSSAGIFETTWDVADVPGSTDALGFLTLEDNATVERDHFEWGYDPDYDAVADAPIVAEYDDLVISGYGGSVVSDGGNNVIADALTTSPVAICATAPYAHTRRWKVRARMRRTSATSEAVYARLSWKAGADGRFSANTWVELPAVTAWLDLDLGTVAIPRVIQGDQEWTGKIEAYAETATGSLYIDYLYFIPAYRYGKVRTDDGHVINADQSTQVRHDAVIMQSTNGAGWTKIPTEGSYLKVSPNRAGRVIVKVRENDVDDLTLVDTGSGGSVIASLVCIPRVVLLG